MNIEISDEEAIVLLEALEFHEHGLQASIGYASVDPSIEKIEHLLDVTGTMEYQLKHLRTLRAKLKTDQEGGENEK
jgi:hypothetical protein